ncbi:MAG: hypothetical protein ABIO65_03445 [Nitrospiria bacterium]
MIVRAMVVAVGLALFGGATSAVSAPPPDDEGPSRLSSTPQAAPAKRTPRRILIFGTTIVGDVLQPTFEKTVPWQSPPAFQADAEPLTHDFTKELLEPLDRQRIVPQEEHGH